MLKNFEGRHCSLKPVKSHLSILEKGLLFCSLHWMVSRNISIAFYLPKRFRPGRQAKNFESVTMMGSVTTVFPLLISYRVATLLSGVGIVETKHLRNLRILNCDCLLFVSLAVVPTFVFCGQNGRELGMFQMQCLQMCMVFVKQWFWLMGILCSRRGEIRNCSYRKCFKTK